ncbi:MAG TPA: NlpC/P60 family protein [Actinomycetota bacterium]|nr:NlpC/P60 family protein [Actinomycetota bacterium]
MATAALFWHPISSRPIRGAQLLALAGAMVAPLVLWPRSRTIRAASAAALIVPVVLLALPAREARVSTLRASSVEQMQSFEGVRYVWGGEARTGVDCSGLVRQGLLRAALRRGIRTLDGGLVRRAASIWWNDASARALAQGHLGQTRVVMEAASLNSVATDRLLPGDFAVTRDGVHALAYVDGNRWISADPNLGGVATVRTPTDMRWFNVPVRIVRWRTLDS